MIDDIKPPVRRRPASAPPVPQTKTPVAKPESQIDLSQSDEEINAASVAEPVHEAPPEISLDDEGKPEPNSGKKTKKKRRSPRAWFRGLSKKKKILVIAGLVLLILAIIGGGYAYYVKAHPPYKAEITVKKATVVVPTTVASPLTGEQVAPELAKRSVTGVMIENSLDARPQASLNQAGIVFEAVAEGGITRFLSLYQEAQPDYIGPVRSARPYYLDWLLPFDASYAHVGGSPDALAQINDLKVKDLNQFYNAAAFQRISSRAAPHNVYTSTAALKSLEQAKGFTTSTFTSLPRKKAEPSTTPTVTSVDLAISGPLYNVHYDYDKTTNTYKRFEGGKPHTDDKSGTQIAPKVVVALVTTSHLNADRKHTDYNTTGTGTMYVFQDGTVTQGTWTKNDRKAQFSFAKADNSQLKLNPGQTWFTMVGATSNVTYK